MLAGLGLAKQVTQFLACFRKGTFERPFGRITLPAVLGQLRSVEIHAGRACGLSSPRADAPNDFRPVAFRGKDSSAYLCRLPFANVRAAIHVQHLPGNVRSLG